MEIPKFIDVDLWLAFVEMRRAMGKKVPFTDFAQRLTVKKLVQMYEEGYCPNAALEQSIIKGWRGVFPGELRKADPKQVDPAIKKIQEDSKKAAPMPAEVRAKIAELARGMRV